MLINHNIRNNSSKEANQVKALLKNIKLNVVIKQIKKKLRLIFKVKQEKLDTIYYQSIVKKKRKGNFNSS